MNVGILLALAGIGLAVVLWLLPPHGPRKWICKVFTRRPHQLDAADLERLPSSNGTTPRDKHSLNTSTDLEGYVPRADADDVADPSISDDVLLPRCYQLPADLPDFTGRVSKIALVEALLTKKRAVVLTGMGGAGKSTLAVHLGHRLAESYVDGQLVIRMGGASTPIEPMAAMESVIHSFFPSARLPKKPEDLAATYCSILASRDVLIILDNALNGPQVRPLIPPSPSVAIVTSRETIVLDGVQSVTLNAMSSGESHQLLDEILGPDRATEQEVVDLAIACGGLPLALRVAGAFLTLHPDWLVAEYLTELENNRTRLMRLRIEGDPKLDVLASLGLSMAQLEHDRPNLAAGWRMLGTFSEDFDRSAVAAVWDVQLEEARDGLSDLVKSSMVLFDERLQRYYLHDLMRDMANGADLAGPDAAALAPIKKQASARHAEHYLKILESALDIERELPNITSAINWSHKNGVWDSLAESILILDNFLKRKGNWSLRSGLLKVALEAADRNKQLPFQYILHKRLGVLSMHQGNFSVAIDSFERILQLAKNNTDQNEVGAALHSLGRIQEAKRDYPRARKYYQECLKVWTELRDIKAKGPTLHELGVVAYRMENFKEAEILFEDALEIERKFDDRYTEATTLHAQGLLAAKTDGLAGLEKAAALYQESLAIKRHLNEREEIARTLIELGKVQKQFGDLRDAEASFDESEKILRLMGHRYADHVQQLLIDVRASLDR